MLNLNFILKQIDELTQDIQMASAEFDEIKLQQIKEYYRIGLTYTSNALEGNSLTESETQIVLYEGITIGGRRLIDHLEAVGHSNAYDFLFTRIEERSISEEDIKAMHQLFYFRIDPNAAGVYRKQKAFITGSAYPLPAPDQLNHLMKECMQRIEALKNTEHPVVAAAQAHKEFVFIHPFIDGNGRVARLLMNLVLLQKKYTIAIIPPVTRSEYIRTLEKAHVNDEEFVEFIARMIRETQRDYIRLFCR